MSTTEEFSKTRPSFKYMEILAEGNGELTGIDNSASSLWQSGPAGNVSHFTYPHGLGITPAFLAYADYDYSGTVKRAPVPGGVGFLGATSFPFTGYVQAIANDENLEITFITAPHVDNSAVTIKFKFFIFQKQSLLRLQS
jgi:hypothetical protein